MKNKFKYIFAMFMAFSVSACQEDFLEIAPQDQPTVDNFYGSEAEIKAATGSLYGRPWFEYNDKFSWAGGDGLAGDLYNDYQHEGQLFFFSFSDNNDILSQAWRGLYNVVAFSNAIINDMPPVASRSGVSQEAINRGVAEARLFRALAYYILTENWGEVPIVENAAALVNSGNMDVQKNTKGSVYEFIVRDLEFAAEHLPASDMPGRVTKWSAKGLLSKVYLTRGQYNKSADDFQKAAENAKDVIENSGLSLMSNYADLFKIQNNNNPETLIALQWISGAWGTGNSRQAVFGRSSLITGNTEAWGGGKSATYSFMQNLQDNAAGKTDKRQPSIYMVLGNHYPEMSQSTGGYTYNIVTANPEGGNALEYKSPLLNNIKKYVVGSMDDVGVPVNNQAVPLNQYMLRLADVYLVYAEAVLGLATSTSDPKALEYYNAVRTRAGLEPRTSLTFEDIFNERRVEFGMEGINWFDVKRRFYRDQNEAVAYLNKQERALTFQRKTASGGTTVGDENSWEGYELEAPSTPVVVTPAAVEKLPIPNGEITINPLLAPGVEAVEYNFE